MIGQDSLFHSSCQSEVDHKFASKINKKKYLYLINLNCLLDRQTERQMDRQTGRQRIQSKQEKVKVTRLVERLD